MTRKNFSFKNTKEAPEIMRARLYIGLLTRVAKQLGLSSSHVNRVAKGKSPSKRVSDAIVLEVRRIERQTRSAA